MPKVICSTLAVLLLILLSKNEQILVLLLG